MLDVHTSLKESMNLKFSIHLLMLSSVVPEVVHDGDRLCKGIVKIAGTEVVG